MKKSTARLGSVCALFLVVIGCVANQASSRAPGPDDPLARCVERSAICAEVMTIDPPEYLSVGQRADFQLWRAALAISGVRGSDRVACLAPYPEEQLRTALTAIHPEVVPGEECGIRGDRMPAPMVHLSSGRLAVEVRMTTGRTSLTSIEGLVLHIWWQAADLYGQGYECPLSVEDDRVAIGSCVPTVAS